MALTFNPFTGTFDISGTVPAGTMSSIGTFGSTPTPNGAIDSNGQLILEPADATNPGSVSITTQSFGGQKTFVNLLLAAGGVDTTASGTLAIGTSNASIVNIGSPSATVNLQGTVNILNTTDLAVTDKLITVNVGGPVGSASNSGIQIEENAIITGYAESSADRNSWILKAPNTAGIITLTPGASGFTIDQGSHNPVTIGTANGLSIAAGQVLSLGIADASNTGALTSFDWNTFNNKQGAGNYITALTGEVTATGPGSVAATISNNAITTVKINNGAVDLTTKVSGLLPTANGGTNHGDWNQGEVPFPDSLGTSLISAPEFFWNDAVKRLRIIGDLRTFGTNRVFDDETDNANAIGGVISLTDTITANNSSYSHGFQGSIYPIILTSISDTGTMGAIKAQTFRGTDPTDQGTLDTMIAVDVTYGSDPACDPAVVTNNAIGLTIYPQSYAGTINNLYDIFVQPGSLTGTTVGQQFGIYIAPNDIGTKFNYLTGKTILGGVYFQPTAELDVNGAARVRGLSTGTVYSDSNGNLTNTIQSSTGDIQNTSFTAADNQVTPANVTGLAFSNGVTRSFSAIVSVVRNSTYSQYRLYGIQKASSWELAQESVGDSVGIIFSITSSGQVQYTSTSTGFTALLKFRAVGTSV